MGGRRRLVLRARPPRLNVPSHHYLLRRFTCLLPAGTFSKRDLIRDIEADIKAHREGQIQMRRHGQGRLDHQQGTALDELRAAKNSTWRPKHA